MRQEIARLVHQVDAQLVVLDADVHVHAADDEAPADAGEVAGDRLVASRSVGSCVLQRANGWVEAAIGAMPCFAATSATVRRRPASSAPRRLKSLQRRCRPRSASSGTRAPPACRAACSHSLNSSAGARRKPAARQVDEQVFLLDAEGEGWFLGAHGLGRLRSARMQHSRRLGAGHAGRGSLYAATMA